MPKYSNQSSSRLATCNKIIVAVFNSVIRWYDNTIIQGRRSRREQKENFAAGKTTTMDSKHLRNPSDAVDATPFPVPKDWGTLNEVLKSFAPHERKKVLNLIKERMKFYHFAGYVQGQADLMGTPLRWGGDWDGDKNFSDQKFDDLVHFETMD